MNDVGNSNNTAIPGTSAWDQMASPGKFYSFLNYYLLKMNSQMQLNFFVLIFLFQFIHKIIMTLMQQFQQHQRKQLQMNQHQSLVQMKNFIQI